MRHKILIIKLAALGDVVCAARALADVFGQIPTGTEFHWLMDPSYPRLAASLLSNIGFNGVHFHEVDSTALFQGSTGKKLLVTAGLLRQCAQLKPSAIVLLHRDARYKLALRTVFRGPIYGVDKNHLETLLYEQTFNRLKEDLFPNHSALPSTKLEFPVVERDHLGLLVGGGTNPKGSFLEKRWPYLEDLIEAILQKTSYKISLFGGPEDTAIAEKIFSRFSTEAHSGRIVNLVGQTPLQDLPLLLRKLRFFIGSDSGLAHVAATVMTSSEQRVITLFGPTDPVFWAPVARGEGRQHVLYKKIECSPCYKNDGNFRPCIYTGESFQRCMKEIKVDEVLALLN